MKVEIFSATQTAVDHLKDLIITGELKPGQKINETALASDMGLSRPPLREALRILESECLITSVPRKSTYITEVSKEDFEKIYQARGMIECYSIDLIKTKNINDFSPLYNALDKASAIKLESGGKPKEILECLKVFAEFHLKLVELTGNNYLRHFYKSIASNLMRYQFLYFSKEYKKPLVEEHRRILELIKMGEYDQAKDCLLSHINYGFEQIIKEEF
ncbi:MAG: GntR family transcriptional regulator [Thermodesulfobacteriota bacterium]